MLRLEERKLERARFEDLYRLARWLGVLPNSVARKEGTYREQKRAVICAILREEKRLARQPQEKPLGTGSFSHRRSAARRRG